MTFNLVVIDLQNEIAMEMVEARKKIVYLEERLAQTSLKLQKMEVMSSQGDLLELA